MTAAVLNRPAASLACPYTWCKGECVPDDHGERVHESAPDCVTEPVHGDSLGVRLYLMGTDPDRPDVDLLYQSGDTHEWDIVALTPQQAHQLGTAVLAAVSRDDKGQKPRILADLDLSDGRVTAEWCRPRILLNDSWQEAHVEVAITTGVQSWPLKVRLPKSAATLLGRYLLTAAEAVAP